MESNYNENVKIIKENEFEEKFVPLIKAKKSFIAYFYGDYDKETGESWCSDCNISRPIIEEAISVLSTKNNGGNGLIFVKLPIETSQEWKKKDFVYRTHPKVKLTKVPTMLFFNDGVEYGRLIEGELHDKENVIEFIDQILNMDNE